MRWSPCLLLALAAGCSPPPAQPVHLTGKTMGTIVYNVKLDALPEGASREALQAEVDARLERVNDLMSTYRPESELSRFNRHEGTGWFDVSEDTARVVARALEVGHATGGAFDVTVGPLVNLWGFGPEGRPETVPTDESIAAAGERTGRDKLDVRLDPPALRKARPDVYVDLSAIAKGFAVDDLAELLESRGVTSYFVEIGGEVRVRGTKPGGSPWRVGIEKPVASLPVPERVLTLTEGALATSGDYRNFFELDGRRYSHTIDPRTGRPVEHQLASVSVLAEDCTTADAWATALLVLGPDEAYNLAQDRGLAVRLVIRTEDGFTERTTPDFPE